jgi:hypothetical protein
MNILFLANTTTRFWPNYHPGFPTIDYVCDGLLHGFKQLYGNSVVDIPRKDCMYKSSNVDKLSLYGRGFTISKTLDDDDADRTDIEQKIKDKFFDVIVYGSVHRNREYIDLCTKVYPKSQIIFVDGEDDFRNTIDYSLVDKGTYFKRELLIDDPNIHPISLSFPEEKISKPNYNKLYQVAKTMPSQGGDTHIWTEEKEYYEHYNQSYFGMTWAKGGWESYRHYEIIMSYCCPFFLNLENCPPRCLTTLPKEKIIKTNNHFANKEVKESEIKYYYQCMDEIFSHSKKYLTTKYMATKILLDALKN